MRKLGLIAGAAVGAVVLGAASIASATTFTTTSPSGGALPSGVTAVGGIVLDLTGVNGARIVSQLSASSLYVGYAYIPTFTIGTQTGFNSSILSQLGGGLQSASVRISLYDGDSGINDGIFASGDNGIDDFDAFQDTLKLNGISFGDFSSVTTQNTDSTGGTGSAGSGVGFRNDLLDTGFFTATNSQLAAFYNTLTSGNVVYSLTDLSDGDNYFDFTQGIDGGLINVGTGPIVTPPAGGVPEPASWAMMILGAAAIGGALRLQNRKMQTSV